MAISSESFDINKVIFCDPETDGYGNINVQAKYERNGKLGPITFNQPIVRTDSNGVTTQKSENGGGSHSIKVFFPRKKPIFIRDFDPETNEEIGGHYEEPDTIEVLSDPNDPNSEKIEVPNDYPEAQAYVDIYDKIYNKAVEHCFTNKMKLGFKDSKQRIMVEAQLKNPVYRRSISETDDTEDPNFPPSIYFKFIESGSKGNPPNTVYTTFTGVDQKPIHWTTLENTMMYLAPTTRVERIFLGAKKNIQCKVTKAIVLETKAREDMSNDTKQLQDLIDQNPGLLQAFIKNLGGLEKYREVKRESGFVRKTQKPPTEIKAQPLPNNPPNEDEDETAKEIPKSPPHKTDDTASPLENFMKQGTTPAKRVIPRRTAITKS